MDEQQRVLDQVRVELLAVARRGEHGRRPEQDEVVVTLPQRHDGRGVADPAEVDADPYRLPSGMTSVDLAGCHSASLMAAWSVRVGRLQVKRRQCAIVIVGVAILAFRLATVMALSGLAALTTWMSSTLPPSGTAHSWSSRRVDAARTKLPLRLTSVACWRMRSRVCSNSLPGSPAVRDGDELAAALAELAAPGGVQRQVAVTVQLVDQRERRE